MTMKKLASILCDGGGDRNDYRRNIYLHKGRLICDKNDITPMPGRYPRTQAGTNQALDDIEAMYSSGVWELEFHEYTSPVSAAAAAMGRVKSNRKAASSRENGRKGGRPALPRYMHKETGSIDTRDGWISSYDPEELGERGMTAEQCFDADEDVTLFAVTP
jgi:hypothetical protein